MLDLLKNLIQLILSPGNGWADLGKNKVNPETLQTKGLYPLLGVMAMTEFLALIYHHGISFGLVLTCALAALGAYFVTIYIGRLIFEVTLPGITSGYDREKGLMTIIMGVGLMAFIKIIDNCMPWKSVVLNLLPLYAVLVLYRAHQYLGIRPGAELRYLGISAVALVVVPIVIYSVLVLLYPA